MGCFVPSRVWLSRLLWIRKVRFMALLVSVWLARLQISECIHSPHHHAAGAALESAVSRESGGKQYSGSIPLIGRRLAVEESHTSAEAARPGVSGPVQRRDLGIARKALEGHSIKGSSEQNSSKALPEKEVEALTAFKAAITIDPHDALSSWIVGAAPVNDSDACTSWAGVTCSSQSPYHVVALSLSNLQLAGSLDSALRKLDLLPFLQSLDLSMNAFSGSIHGDVLTNSSYLSYFNLSYNAVTGGIPFQIDELIRLQDLDVTGNNMTGLIPESLGNCSLLRSIILPMNTFEGDIPASLGSLSGLEYLDVSYNLLSGFIPGTIGNCSSLRLFNLDGNVHIGGEIPQGMSLLKQLQLFSADTAFISGAFPLWIGNLTSLSEFSIVDSNLEGEIPSTIGQLRFLEAFGVGINQMSGVIPLSICNLTSLGALTILYTNLSGHIPPLIGVLPNLFFLSLAGNQLTGVIPPSLANCSTLVELELGSNELMDPEPIPSWIESLTNLQGIYLSNMNLQGEIPQQSFGRMPDLTKLAVANNNLTGTIPRALQNCTHLINVDVAGNFLTGSIPPELGVLRYMSHFIAERNYLTGPFPEFIANWTELSLFTVQNNNLSGVLELRLGQLQQLDTFAITENDFGGTIPETIGNCTSLSQLLLGSNRFGGGIPASLGNLTILQRLDLSHNNLQGPVRVSLLKSNPLLNDLDLSWNKLHGSLILEIGQLVQLLTLLLAHNKFSGIVPNSLGNCTQITRLDLSNNQFEGSLPAAAISKMSPSLVALNLSHNHFTGPWPREFAQLASVQSLDVSSNNISGPIPVGLGKCASLRTLDVSINNLTGEIPQDLGSLAYLRFFNASFNNFIGPLPQSGIFNSNRISELSFLGNPGLCGPVATVGLHHPECAAIPFNVSTNQLQGNGFNYKKVWIPVTTVSSLIVLLAIITILGIWPWKYSSRLGIGAWRGGKKNSKSEIHIMLNFNANVRLTERDVLKIIRDPRDDNIIGKGARSIVYKGDLPGGKVAAVKNLLPLDNDQIHAHKGKSNHIIINDSDFGALDSHLKHSELAKEAKILAQLRHKNILQCLGFYSGYGHNVLIVEYMSGGSLHEHLYELESSKLTWQTRLKVAMGVAQGMKYLHHDFVEPLVHRDLKPSNVLLDADLEPRICDFGISRFVTILQEVGGEATTSQMRGTFGYMPPEYASQFRVSTEGDVYSYGMVLIELITRRQPCSTIDVENEARDLRSLVLEHFHERPFQLLDPSLVMEGRLDSIATEQMMLLLRASLFCTRANPHSRPSMITVIDMLTYIINLRVEPTLKRSIEELANEVTPTPWVFEDPAAEVRS